MCRLGDRFLTQENAALGLLTTVAHLENVYEAIDPSIIERLTRVLEASTDGVDRYTVHYCLEAIGRVGRVLERGSAQRMAQHRLFEKLGEERWCPFTHASSQF